MERHQIEEHIIIQGDVEEALMTIPDNSVDLIFADPPYNIGKSFEIGAWESEEGYLNWCYKWIDLCTKKLSPSGTMYLMAATQFMPFIDIYVRSKLHILSRIIWYYDSSGRQAKRYFGSMYEPIIMAVADKQNYTFNSEQILVEAKTGAKRKLIDYRKNPPQQYSTTKVPGNVWYFPRVRFKMPEYRDHPSQKPEKLLRRIIAASSNSGDTVLDPFSGTFTTTAVGAMLGRRTIGIEIRETYVREGISRLKRTLSQL